MTPKRDRLVVEESLGERLEGWYDRNGMLINVLLAGIVAVVIGYSGYKAYHTRTVNRANAAFGAAQERLYTAVQEQDPAKKKDDLQGAITAAQQVVADYSGQFVGRQAQLMIANAQYELAAEEVGKKPDTLEKARENFEKYIQLAETNQEKAAGHLGRGNVLENLAFIQSDNKQLDAAIKDYQNAVSAAGDSYLGRQAKLALARAQAAQTAKEAQEQARKVYQEVADSKLTPLTTADVKDLKPVALVAGPEVSAEQIASILNFTHWSQKQVALDSLSQLK